MNSHSSGDPAESQNFGFVRSAFEEKLNRHGYAFQYSVLKEAEKAFDDKRVSRWRFEAAEVPVRAQNRETRIDFILSRHRSNSQLQRYLICECKRVNRARGNWCFVRAPFVHKKRHFGHQGLLLECAETFDGEFRASAHPGNMIDPYGIGLAVKSEETGDHFGKSDDDAIEQAASQVLLGVSGFVETLRANQAIMKAVEGTVAAILIPVIFTTAELWVSDSNLSDADLTNGKISLASAGFARSPWIWFSYHASPGLRHSVERRTIPATVPHLMDDDYIRHIAIVNSQGIEQFLRWSSDSDSLF